jgi:hypothetical protein
MSERNKSKEGVEGGWRERTSKERDLICLGEEIKQKDVDTPSILERSVVNSLLGGQVEDCFRPDNKVHYGF